MKEGHSGITFRNSLPRTTERIIMDIFRTYDDRSLMKMALGIASEGRFTVSPNPIVGSIVYREGFIYGRGFHRFPGAAHAEVEAIANAKGKCKGATLYATLEPCNHYGRTPPCVDEILDSGISRVVIAMMDLNEEVEGGGAERLRKEGVLVTEGVRETEALFMNRHYIKAVTSRLPYITVKAAVTADGKMAAFTGASKWITQREARKTAHALRLCHDGTMVGAKTVIADNPELTPRMIKPLFEKKTYARVILDYEGELLERHSDFKVFDGSARTVLLTGRHNIDLAGGISGIDDAISLETDESGDVSIEKAMIEIRKLGIHSLLVEGGSLAITSIVEAGIHDEMVLFYAPRLLGDDGISIYRHIGIESPADCEGFVWTYSQKRGSDIMARGFPKDSPWVKSSRHRSRN